MLKKYPPLNKQIEEFGVSMIFKGQIRKIANITSKEDYNHQSLVLHHFIKEQEYYSNPQKYNGKQKLILMNRSLHNDIHSAMSDLRFFKKWGIPKGLVLYTHRKV